MNRILTIVFTLVISIAQIGCKSSKDKLFEEITQMESTLYSDTVMVPDPAAGHRMIGLYIQYVDQFPQDTISPSYLFKAGDLAGKMDETQQSLDLFERMVTEYPEHRNTPFAVFLQGFICENQAGDPAKARPYYEKFLQKYPDHPIAADVAFSLENLGKSPEELIRQFEQNQPDSLINSNPAI
jgi:outer membrane protein assembly factor BamD (BamD/ComL family)